VFDAPEIAEGTVLHQARVFMQGYADVYGTADADTSAVLVIRHQAIPMVLDDAAWDRYGLGKRFKLKDPSTGKSARRNPFINVQADDQYSLVWADGGLDKLQARGAVVLACNLALGFFASTVVVKADKVDRDEAKRRAQAALLPGVTLQPSGIFAVARAEEAGCHYIRAT
jgi:intracellular sulfur oxidation DsrE/DsrF family protein